jgi:hypothetical protein
VASHHLIEEYLAELARHLPADTVDELADGLIETCHHFRASGLAPASAALAAIAEFGTAEEITRGFVAQAPGRRAAVLLLASGPLVGVCWGATLVAVKVWTWPVPVPAAAGLAAALFIIVAVLVAAATSRRSYRRTRLGAAGALGIIVLDALVLVTVLALAPALVWPMLAAIPASLARIGLTLRFLPRALAG